MIKRIFTIVFAIIFCVSMTVCSLAEGEAVTSDDAEEASVQTDEGAYKNLQIYILAGAVIGGMVIVTVIYKKKDEIRYL